MLRKCCCYQRTKWIEEDLLYIWFGEVDAKSAQTVTVVPGVYADLDASGKLIGLEVLDAKEILGKKVQFEVSLPSLAEV